MKRFNKDFFKKLVSYFKHHCSLLYNRLFNKIVRQQLKDIKSVPVIIISFNQLKSLKALVSFLKKNAYKNIVIIDNNSTYKPLLDYFDEIEDVVTIHRLKENLGHLAFWKSQSLVAKYTKGYYVVTDPDVVPLNECPDNFMDTIRVFLDQAYDRTKVGFSLKLDDVPDSNPNKEKIVRWESQFWKVKINDLAFKAELDTTFAIYRPGYKYRLKNFTKAWRTDYPLQARHLGWYIDPSNLSEEQKYYIDSANESASWKINDQGELSNELHKELYNKK